MTRGDEVVWEVMKDYNGRAHRDRAFGRDWTLAQVKEYARRIVEKENRGQVLTVRIYRQVACIRQAKRRPDDEQTKKRKAEMRKMRAALRGDEPSHAT